MDHDRDSKPTVPQQSLQVVASEEGNGSVLSSSKKWCDKAVVTELRKQLKLAGPLVFTGLLQFSMQMISVISVGHLGQVPLASASLATSFAGSTGFSLMVGMGGALETFCGQAYGAELYHMLGVYTQRAMILFTLMSVPVSILWAFTGKILAILKQDSQISAGAGLYARWMIPSIFPFALLQCQVRFLQAQKNTIPLVISSGVTTLFHALGCWILIFKLGFGNKGAPISIGISFWCNVIILALYIKFSPTCQRTWKNFSKESLQNLYAFMKLGAPSALMPGILVISVVSLHVGLSSKSEIRNINDGYQVQWSSESPLVWEMRFDHNIGCARGCGRQKIAAYISLGAYYFVGLPTAMILTFVLHIGGKTAIIFLFLFIYLHHSISIPRQERQGRGWVVVLPFPLKELKAAATL
ncbi:hypothetical protein Tsubulata_007115 [Turnera subulata]|uniref:Protein DETOXIFICATION n=1 Tax=Turnera subulata TaxID=218843 RepID=A0A9Q0JS91_9ROSI|nr:hypothetical protein Tsubulata_007115 [Turnera subulata]